MTSVVENPDLEEARLLTGIAWHNILIPDQGLLLVYCEKSKGILTVKIAAIPHSVSEAGVKHDKLLDDSGTEMRMVHHKRQKPTWPYCD